MDWLFGSRSATERLLAAVRSGDSSTVEELIAGGVCVHCVDKFGNCPLHEAVYWERESIVHLLLKAHANVNQPNELGWTALHEAARNGLVCIIKSLLGANADVDFLDNESWSPLHHAAWYGHQEIVQLLLEANCTITLRDSNGRTALELASQRRHTGIVKLLQHFLSLRLLDAISNHDAAKVKKLINAGAQIKTKSKEINPLKLAIQEGHLPCIVQLLKLYSKENRCSQDLLCLAVSLGQVDTVALLLICGENPGQRDSEGRTPLAIASINGNATITQLLLTEEVDINIQDKDGHTPLHLAAMNNNLPILQLLLSANADKNIKNKTGDTALIVAIKNGHRDVAALLQPPITIVQVTAPDIKVSCENLLGQGSYGIVVKSEWNGASVAIKSSKPSCKHSILNEISIMSKLSSPYLMPLLSIMNEATEQPQMALPYMDQGTVRHYLDKKLAQKDVAVQFSTLEIAWVVANALLDLHTQNIIHRDVKCENIFLCSSNYIKLGDLGIAREYDVQTMTQAVGTLSWIAPEVFDSGHYNVAADIYSFGVVLTELETMQLPYWDCPLKGFSLIDAVRAGNARPSLNSQSELWLRKLTTKCLDTNPENRPTAKAIVSILQEQLKLSRKARLSSPEVE